MVSQCYRPTEYETWSDTHSAGAPTLDGNTLLSVFDGASPSGDWWLFFVDDDAHDVSIATGWSLAFTFTETQSPAGTVNIANGAVTTSTRDVNLGFGASDPAPSSGITQMRFSNDRSTFSTYQPYAASAP